MLVAIATKKELMLLQLELYIHYQQIRTTVYDMVAIATSDSIMAYT